MGIPPQCGPARQANSGILSARACSYRQHLPVHRKWISWMSAAGPPLWPVPACCGGRRKAATRRA